MKLTRFLQGPAKPTQRHGFLLFLLLSTAAGLPVCAQNVADKYAVSPAPVFTGGVGFVTQVQGGHPVNGPVSAPVLLVPIGDNWLVEGRGDFEGDIESRTNSGVKVVSQNNLDYLQLDYIAGKYATITVGRFLTPFGIYNERLYPVWIRTLQSEPLILPLGTEAGSSNGAMVRGGIAFSKNVDWNYTAYYSTLGTVPGLSSERTTGGRAGFFFPKLRLEIGASGQHLLDGDHTNAYGLHLAWQPAAIPLSLHGEYAYAAGGKGYWLETAYRLSSMSIARRVAKKTEVVTRMQQYFVGTNLSENAALGLPTAQTNQFDFGVNYYLRDDLRVQTAYGRVFTAGGNENQWSVGITYRFALSLLPRGAQ